MKRLHVHVAVDDLEKSIKFYSSMFGEKPSKQKSDYAKWMLEDPRVNFAISARGAKAGLDHLGLQVDSSDELEQLREQMKAADMSLFGEGETTCCYAASDKSWVKDPSGIPWEAYHTMADAEIFSSTKADEGSACCAPDAKPSSLLKVSDNGGCSDKGGCC